MADLLTSVAWSSLRASLRGDLSVPRTCPTYRQQSLLGCCAAGLE